MAPLTRYMLLLMLCAACAMDARAQDLLLPREEPLRYLALGDSYTIGQGVTAPERWPEQLRDSLEAAGYGFDTLRIIAATGWNTGSLLNNIRGRGLAGRFNLVSLLIGVNNQFQGGSVMLYADQFNQLLDSALVYAGGNTGNVLVLSIPDYAYTPIYQNNPAISQAIDQFNTVNRLICRDRNVPYFDITPISRNNDAAMVSNDGLHPSGYQYSLWVREIMAAVERLTATAVNENPEPVWKIYPVPVSDRMRIELPEGMTAHGGGAEVELIDQAGRVVLRHPASPLNGAGLDMALPEDLANGIYFLKVRSGPGEAFSRKIVVVR